MKLEVILCTHNGYDDEDDDAIEWNITENYNNNIFNEIMDKCRNEDGYVDVRAKLKLTIDDDIIFTKYICEPIRFNWIKLYNGENITIDDDLFHTIISSKNGIVTILNNNKEDDPTMKFSIPLNKLKPYIKNFIDVLTNIKNFIDNNDTDDNEDNDDMDEAD